MRLQYFNLLEMWLIQKIRETVQKNASYQNSSHSPCNGSTSKPRLSLRLHCNVLTPDKIPEFFIPPKHTQSTESLEQLLAQHKSDSSLVENHSKHLEKVSLLYTQSKTQSKDSDNLEFMETNNQHIIEIDSIEDSDVPRNKITLKECETCPSSGWLPDAASCYGFTGFFESPNTRRKESLFHIDFRSFNLQKSRGKFPTKQLQSFSGCLAQESLNISKLQMSACIPCHCCTADKDNGVPCVSFMLPSYFQLGSSVFDSTDHQDLSGDASRSTSQLLQENSLSSIHDSSSLSSCLCAHQKTTACSLVPPAFYSFKFLQCQEWLQKEHLLPLIGRGQIRLSAEYKSGSCTLRIRVVSVEDLYDNLFDERCIHCCVILCLIPGKLQRQQSAIIKNSKNPIFNEDFFFDGVTVEDLNSMSLKLKVINKASSLKRDTVLGSNELPLFQLLPH
ncbi:C2 calcium-dependent domain-containing protein 4C-like [Polypterus senegalus]|nr:C2 calcium-dependent domain-containing protein 4C-like [Polypterus senegalus]